jgi:hypothetical protein
MKEVFLVEVAAHITIPWVGSRPPHQAWDAKLSKSGPGGQNRENNEAFSVRSQGRGVGANQAPLLPKSAMKGGRPDIDLRDIECGLLVGAS